jgi:hypothetical protein
MSSQISARPSTAAAPDIADRRAAWLDRYIPLSGVVFAVLTAVGLFTIDEFPDAETPVSELTGYYAAHHAQVGRGGAWIAYSVIFFLLFGASVWARIRRSSAPPVLGAFALLASALFAAGTLTSADMYAILGQLAGRDTTTPEALQAVHLLVSAGAPMIHITVVLLAVAAPAFLGRALPIWLGSAAVILVVLQFTPLSFLAWLLFHLWVAAVGITMAVRPLKSEPPHRPAQG